MIAFIFAAGLGTRLKPLTDTMPKALVPVSNKPLLQHVLEKLAKAGFDEFIINVHHFADMIEFWCHAAMMQSDAFHISFSDERAQLLETGGGIKHAAPLLQDTDHFLIHNVDILSNCDLQSFWQAGITSDAQLLVSERDTQRYLIFDSEMRLMGWTNIKTGEVKSPYPAVHENPRAYSLYAFAGIHMMDTRLIKLMDSFPDKFSIIDFYLSICDRVAIRGYIQPDLRLMDVGKLDTLDQAEAFVTSANI